MFKNWHVIIAMIVAPILAVLAWFAVDYFVAERPHAAKEGAAYSLIAKSNCRVQLELTSAFPLQSATLGVVNNGIPAHPAEMKPTTDESLHWTSRIDRPEAETSTIRVAVTADGSTWYAEIPVTFLRLGG
jgi:hypothetical protein